MSPSRVKTMDTHLDKNRFLELVDGTEFLTPEERKHLEHCPDCVEKMAEQIREGVRRKAAGGQPD